MRVVVLTNKQSNQVALCHKIKEFYDIQAIVCSENIPRKAPVFSKKVKLLLNGFANRTIGKSFVQTWFGMLEKYEKLYSKFPLEKITNVRNVNDEQTIKVIRDTSPDLVIVSGTNLVGKNVINASSQTGLGIVNLHTGISPYVKGGPNCTNWCLAKNWFHLIGNTVMWLDLGIDTGNIIGTEQTPLNGTESLPELHWKVMEHGHDLYLRAIKKISQGNKVLSIPQNELGEGNIFYSTQWTGFQMMKALNNFEQNYKTYFTDLEKQKELNAEIKLFPLSEND